VQHLDTTYSYRCLEHFLLIMEWSSDEAHKLMTTSLLYLNLKSQVWPARPRVAAMFSREKHVSQIYRLLKIHILKFRMPIFLSQRNNRSNKWKKWMSTISLLLCYDDLQVPYRNFMLVKYAVLLTKEVIHKLYHQYIEIT
jgi:hypothetical protein